MELEGVALNPNNFGGGVCLMQRRGDVEWPHSLDLPAPSAMRSSAAGRENASKPVNVVDRQQGLEEATWRSRSGCSVAWWKLFCCMYTRILIYTPAGGGGIRCGRKAAPEVVGFPQEARPGGV